MTRPALIVGSNSDIGTAIAHALAARGHGLQLAARAPGDRLAADIAARHGVAVSTHVFDVTDIAGAATFLDSLPEMPGIVVSVAGLLGDQAATRGDSERISQIIAVNFTGPAVVLEAAAARIGSGWVIGISSVSGDRGRASNYWYGAAKAGLSTMLSGLRQRYAGSNVRVMVVKPGFVATRMTRGMKLIGPLTNTPEEIAALVCKAMDRGREVVYPFRWKLVMLVLRTVPEWIYRRLKL